MDLKDFISRALQDIVAGIVEANAAIATHDAEINPRAEHHFRDGDSYVEQYSEFRKLQQIEFDVAVTASESDSKKGGIGVATGFVGIGGSKTTATNSESLSRVKFTVPLLLPRGRDRSSERNADRLKHQSAETRSDWDDDGQLL